MTHEQIGIGGGHKSAHGRAFDLEMMGVEGGVVVGEDSAFDLKVMMGVEGEVVVGEDKLGQLDKELSG